MSEHPEHQSKQERALRRLLDYIDGLDAKQSTTNANAMFIDARGFYGLKSEAITARAALSDVTEEQEILSDCSELQGEKRDEDEGRNAPFDEAPGIRKALNTAIDFAEWGWTIIANAHGGNWELESKDWQEAAAKYRDDFHNTIRYLAGVPSPKPVASTQPQDGLIQKTSELGEDKKE